MKRLSYDQIEREMATEPTEKKQELSEATIRKHEQLRLKPYSNRERE